MEKSKDYKGKKILIKDIAHETGYTFKDPHEADLNSLNDYGYFLSDPPRVITDYGTFALRKATREECQRTLSGMESFRQIEENWSNQEVKPLEGLELRQQHAEDHWQDIKYDGEFREHYVEEPKRQKSGMFDFLTGFFFGNYF
jgi:hypothetical protein